MMNIVPTSHMVGHLRCSHLITLRFSLVQYEATNGHIVGSSP